MNAIFIRSNLEKYVKQAIFFEVIKAYKILQKFTCQKTIIFDNELKIALLDEFRFSLLFQDYRI